MKWCIPAKTFLIGEYVALHAGPAIILNTKPCFEVTLTDEPGLQNIHPDSPGGKWWLKQDICSHGLAWHDPYQGLGGLGASSAQFLGAYVASRYLKTPFCQPISIDELMHDYLDSAWQGIGLQPSGYDVLAQHLQGCSYIYHQQHCYETIAWPFHDMAFILLRTGIKIPTHEHLNQLNLNDDLIDLLETAKSGCQAFQVGDSQGLIDSINIYHNQLKQRHWVSPYTLECIDRLHETMQPLAIKGCGALGADVLFVLISSNHLDSYVPKLIQNGWNVLATSRDLTLAESSVY